MFPSHGFILMDSEETVILSEAEVRECAIRFGHSVDVFTFLDGTTTTVSRVSDFTS